MLKIWQKIRRFGRSLTAALVITGGGALAASVPADISDKDNIVPVNSVHEHFFSTGNTNTITIEQAASSDNESGSMVSSKPNVKLEDRFPVTTELISDFRNDVGDFSQQILAKGEKLIALLPTTQDAGVSSGLKVRRFAKSGIKATVPGKQARFRKSQGSPAAKVSQAPDSSRLCFRPFDGQLNRTKQLFIERPDHGSSARALRLYGLPEYANNEAESAVLLSLGQSSDLPSEFGSVFSGKTVAKSLDDRAPVSTVMEAWHLGSLCGSEASATISSSGLLSKK